MTKSAIASVLAAVWVAAILPGPGAHALEVWAGPPIVFDKAAGSWTIPGNQDVITPGVIITRNTSQGLFNAASETIFTRYVSPAGTEWASGSISNYATLVYRPWLLYIAAINGGAECPPCAVGVPSVVHLIAEDIYIPITMNSWGSAIEGGPFNYTRGTQPGIATENRTWGSIKALYNAD